MSIAQHPAIVNERCRLGDWEGDTIIGASHRQALVSLTERHSRLTLLQKVTCKIAEAVSAAVRTLLAPLAAKVQTLSSDNKGEKGDKFIFLVYCCYPALPFPILPETFSRASRIM